MVGTVVVQQNEHVEVKFSLLIKVKAFPSPTDCVSRLQIMSYLLASTLSLSFCWREAIIVRRLS